MPIDFSTQTTEWWKASFERYITGGGDLTTIMSGGQRGVESHFKTCLPKDSYPDIQLETTNNHWIVTGTHPRGGPFRIQMNRWGNDWTFDWI